MEALNHANQMRLASLINDNSDDAEIQKKLDQVVELTRSTREQAAFVLHDCNYDVEKAVDMILEGDHATVENQWKSAGKKKNKNTSNQGGKAGAQTGGGSGGAHNSNAHGGQHKNANSNNKQSNQSSSTNAGTTHMTSGGSHHSQPSHHTNKSSSNHANSSNLNASNQYSNNTSSNAKHEATDNFKSLAISSSNLISSSDSTTTATAPSKATSLQQHQQQLQRSAMQAGGATRQHQKSTRIPDSAVEMPNNELQVSSLNVQFGELDLKDGSTGASDVKGSFQDVIESNRMGRQPGTTNPHSSTTSQDSKNNRQTSQQNLGRGAARRPYNNNNTNDDRRFYSNSNRGGRQMTGNQRPYGQRPGTMNSSNNNSRGVRTILNRGLQHNSSLTNSNANQPTSGFPNSIDTWTNSTAEAATKTTSSDQSIGVGSTLRVGQWSDVAGNEDWSEEDWDAKVMETKVFTPSSKAVDGPAANQKNQPLLANTSVPSQINLASKLSESVRDDVNSQQSTLNAVTQKGQTQQSSQKPISHMNEIFDASVAKAMLEQQNLAAIKPKTSIGMNQYNKDASDAKTVLDQQSLSSMKPKTTMSMNQYNKDASESLKSLVGISSTKGSVPSVPPGALPLMSQPQYIMGNAYQPAIFPYAYQTPDVHYQVAAQTAGREQNFQSVYSPSDANKFNRGTDGDAPSITTTQAAPVASQTHNQAFVANALPGYQLTYAMPGAFNMMPQNLYSAAPIFPHIPQPTNTGSANTVYQKNTPASYQHHAGYSTYDQLNLIQDYVKQQQNYSGSNMQQQQHQQQQPTSKASGVSSDLDVTSGGNSYNVYGSMNKTQPQSSKQTNYNDNKGYQQQMSGNGAQQQFGFSHNAQPTSIAGYPLLQAHGLDGSNLNSQSSAQQLPQHSGAQRSGGQVNPNKYYPSWN